MFYKCFEKNDRIGYINEINTIQKDFNTAYETYINALDKYLKLLEEER
jgi:hypothetical protein